MVDDIVEWVVSIQLSLDNKKGYESCELEINSILFSSKKFPFIFRYLGNHKKEKDASF